METWTDADRKFVMTTAASNVYESILNNSFVIVTGNSGVGKTATVRHTALLLKKDGYTVVPISRPKDILYIYNNVPNAIFVLDDLCGRFTLNQQYIDAFKQVLDDIKILLDSEIYKIIATCRLQVFKDERFKVVSDLNFKECNMNSMELRLSAKEKIALAENYCGENAIDIINVYSEYDFFPFVCNMYDIDKHDNALQFTKHPFTCFDEELDQFLKEGQEKGKHKYCAICLIVMCNNQLHEQYLRVGDNMKQEMIENALVESRLNKTTSLENILDALNTLDGSLVIKEDNVYRMVHDKVFDYIAVYFGKTMLRTLIRFAESGFICERFLWQCADNVGIDDIDFIISLPDNIVYEYIQRMVADWKRGQCTNVFQNRNMISTLFSEKILCHIDQLDESDKALLSNMCEDINGNTSLIGSCYIGNANVTQWILKHSSHYVKPFDILFKWFSYAPNKNICNNNGVTPVYIACEQGHLQILNKLIEWKADIDMCLKNGTTPVFIACCKGYLHILNKLIECKADINKCKNSGASPVYIACQMGHLEILNRLIKSKADIYKCRNGGASPVFIACQNGHLDILNRFLEFKIDINKCCDNGTSLVFTACEQGHLHILERLIEYQHVQVDINQCRNNGASPFYIACRQGHLQIVNRLIESNADINKCREDGTSPVYIACKQGYLEILDKLIECKADINKCREDGTSLVYLACQQGHLKILNKLIECKADITTCREDGTSPLDIACYKGHLQLLNRLIECNIDINRCRKDGTSAVFIACEQGHLHILNRLIQCDVDLNKCRADGASPVFIACQQGFLEILNVLIECNADINKCGNDGTSPIHIACRMGHYKIFERLRKC